jgi:hypothetical protein
MEMLLLALSGYAPAGSLFLGWRLRLLTMHLPRATKQDLSLQ